jgi:hypothetical protein
MKNHLYKLEKKSLSVLEQSSNELNYNLNGNNLIQDSRFQDCISTLRQLHCNKRQHIYNNIIMVNRANSQREKINTCTY